MSIYVPSVSTFKVNTDSQAAAAAAWRIASTGHTGMDGVAIADLEGTRYPFTWLIDSADGRLVYNRTPGVILAGVPFYWALNQGTDPEQFEVWVGGVAAAFFTALAGVLLFLGLRSKFGSGTALGASAVFLFTTPAWSVSADALWTHSVTLLAIMGAIWAAGQSRWLLVGVFLGIGILARPHLAVIAAIVGLYLGWRRRDWKIVVSVGATSAIGLLLVALWNRAVFGAWSLSGGYEDYVTSNLVSGSGGLLMSVFNIVGFLFSPDRGLLIWTPLILVLLPSLMISWRQLPDWVQAFAVAGIIYSLVQLRINLFLGGQGYYGYRLALELLACLAPALVYAYRSTAPWTRVALGAIIGAQFAAISIGSITEGYLVGGVDVWTKNAYLVALGERPLAFGLLTVFCAFTGALFTGLVLLRLSRPTRIPCD